MKETRCFRYKKEGHIAYNCPGNEKNAAMSDSLTEDSNSHGKK